MAVLHYHSTSNPSALKSAWPKLIMFGVLMLFIFILGNLKTNPATPKQIPATINGLTETYTTTATTVEKFLLGMGIPRNQIISVTPPLTSKLTSQTVVAVETKPALRNAIVAANMQSSIKIAEEALQEKLAQVAAAATKELAETQLKPAQPKSPTYVGLASWYSFGKGMTAASTQFPHGTKLRVIAEESGKTIDITINDYGPEEWTGVMLDLNKPAFAKLAPLGAGKIYIKYYRI